jgi:hypothetical protein
MLPQVLKNTFCFLRRIRADPTWLLLLLRLLMQEGSLGDVLCGVYGLISLKEHGGVQ